MRTLKLSKSGFNKIRAHQKELKAGDFEDSLKSIPPGDWALVTVDHSTYACFINPLVDDKFHSVHVLEEIKPETFRIELFLAEKIHRAINLRRQFAGYEDGSRVFYGAGDGLPGLIADHFTNAVVIQINTAGIDRYREQIANIFQEALKTKAFFLDNPKYREREFLPTFAHEEVPSLVVKENGLTYELRSEVIQKVGFYYDHRENRRALQDLLPRIRKSPAKGLDLFSYAGAWGLNALKGGTRSVDFVDQGDFSAEVARGLEVNGFSDRGAFFRSDVFRFLDDSVSSKRFYDLIMCDPPAFAKSHLQKDQALEGYSKLHRKVFKAAAPGALLVFSSCTHYVSHDEFQKNVLDASIREGKRLQLIHTGIQGWDHPVRSQSDRSNYIKSYFYILES